MIDEVPADGRVFRCCALSIKIDFIIQRYSFIRQESFALRCETLCKFVSLLGRGRACKKGGAAIADRMAAKPNISDDFFVAFRCVGQDVWQARKVPRRLKRNFLLLSQKCTKLK